MKILIVEDEPKTAAFVNQGFTEEGFVVDVAIDGADGLHLVMTGDYDLIVLDIMLPKQDGWSVLQEIRKHRPDQCVIVLTALDALAERVKGLSLGADDYLIKPFAFSELLARVRNLLRRGSVRQKLVQRFADIEMDLSRHRASRGGIPLDLAPQEYRLLEYLLRHSGEVLTRTRLAEQLWDMNFDGDSNVIDVAIRRLRRKVDNPCQRKLIHTLRGVGYVLDERD
ncbi:transcriptional activator protein CzcR [bacterium BMS3Bbin11]|nr:transcriptional activator protein CzcR [bacterium BMS3Abin11]GBE45523.1 transcriptional activator protein CzcR [bacterium BMS3Bbin11]GMT40769.1 MAG: DNA-binding response regulator [bacterium]HDH16577.1 response regulator [Gammaproteobacteria bacterium]HDO73258.1 response regulator [Chromatiales bacterium]